MKDIIKTFYESKTFAKITRNIKGSEFISRGYIVDFSENFIILQESDDFKLLGYCVYPIQTLLRIRYNNNDRYYDKIMGWENEKKSIGLKTRIDLTNWQSIIQSLKDKEKTIIVECEDPEIGSFIIGPIEQITNDAVFIRYFNAVGYFDKELTKIDFYNISKIAFDNRYIDIFSKYTRTRK